MMDMEVDTIVLPDWVSASLQENHITMEEIIEEDISFDEHFVTFPDANYDRGAKRLKIERIQLFDKKVVDRT